MQNNTNWTAVATVFAAGIVGAAYVGKMPTALPQLQQELGLSLIAVSWLVSIFNLIGLCAALLVVTTAYFLATAKGLRRS